MNDASQVCNQKERQVLQLRISRVLHQIRGVALIAFSCMKSWAAQKGHGLSSGICVWYPCCGRSPDLGKWCGSGAGGNGCGLQSHGEVWRTQGILSSWLFNLQGLSYQMLARPNHSKWSSNVKRIRNGDSAPQLHPDHEICEHFLSISMLTLWITMASNPPKQWRTNIESKLNTCYLLRICPFNPLLRGLLPRVKCK